MNALAKIMAQQIELRRKHAISKTGPGSIVVCVWENLLFDKLDFQKALRVAAQELPAEYPAFPLIAFKYSDPIGRYILSASKVGKFLTDEQRA